MMLNFKELTVKRLNANISQIKNPAIKRGFLFNFYLAEAAEISTLIEAEPSATDAVPEYSLNAPRTLVTIAWRALKPMRL